MNSGSDFTEEEAEESNNDSKTVAADAVNQTSPGLDTTNEETEQETEDVSEAPSISTETAPVEKKVESVSTLQEFGNQDPTESESTVTFNFRRDEEEYLATESSMASEVDEDWDEFTEIDISEKMPFVQSKDRSYDTIKKLFETLIADMDNCGKVGIPLDEIKEKFYFIWEGYMESHYNLNNLLKRDQEISVEVAEKMARTRTMIKIADDDPTIAQKLGARLENAWSLVDISEEDEKRNVIRVQQLKDDIFILNRNIQEAQAMEGQTELKELMKIRKKMSDEKDALIKDFNKLQSELEMLNEKRNRMYEKRIEFTDMLHYSVEEMVAQKEALAREKARKQKIMKEIVDITRSIDTKTTEIENFKKNRPSALASLKALKRSVQDQKVLNDAAIREAELSENRIEKLKQDFDAQIAQIEKIRRETIEQQNELKARELENEQVQGEVLRASRFRHLSQKKCVALQDALNKLENDREALRKKITQLERDLERAQKKLAESRKQVDELDKKRGLIDKGLQRAASLISSNETQIHVHKNAVNNLKSEITGYHNEIKDHRLIIKRLEREREIYGQEAAKLAHNVSLVIDETRALDVAISDAKRMISSMEVELKNEIYKYESALTERAYFEKALRETAREITETNLKVSHKNFEIGSLNLLLTIKTKIIDEEMRKLETMERRTEALKDTIHNLTTETAMVKKETEDLNEEKKTYIEFIRNGEEGLQKIKNDIKVAMAKKNDNHRKLMEKNVRLRSLNEHWRILHSMVRIGACHYRKIMVQIYDVRTQIIVQKNQQLKIHRKGNHYLPLCREVSAMEEIIAKERCMVNAINDELSKKINIHRWRTLEVLDPTAYEMVKRINVLNKRLVGRNAEIYERTADIRKKQELLIDIKAILQRTPGLETPEEKTYYELLLKAKKEEYEGLKSDLKTAEEQTAYYRDEASQINKKMQKLKGLYFEQKKMNQARTDISMSDLSDVFLSSSFVSMKTLKAKAKLKQDVQSSRTMLEKVSEKIFESKISNETEDNSRVVLPTIDE